MYKSIDEYSDARTFDIFHDAKVEALVALKENDQIKVAAAIGNMVAQFESLHQHKMILAEKLKG